MGHFHKQDFSSSSPPSIKPIEMKKYDDISTSAYPLIYTLTFLPKLRNLHQVVDKERVRPERKVKNIRTRTKCTCIIRENHY